jgi:acetoacetate decarboxylase
MLMVKWETDPAIIARLLPPPLKLTSRPIATAYVANFPRTSFGLAYREAALSIEAQFDDRVGDYLLAMPVTDDWALILGRGSCALPKKVATTELEHTGREVRSWAERRGVRFAELRANLHGKLNAPEAARRSRHNPIPMGPRLRASSISRAPRQ